VPRGAPLLKFPIEALKLVTSKVLGVAQISVEAQQWRQKLLEFFEPPLSCILLSQANCHGDAMARGCFGLFLGFLCLSLSVPAMAEDLVLRGAETALSDFPDQLLKRPPPDLDDAAYEEWLKSRPALVLDGTTLRLGRPGAAIALSIQASRIELRNSQIITYGAELRLSALQLFPMEAPSRRSTLRSRSLYVWRSTARDRAGLERACAKNLVQCVAALVAISTVELLNLEPIATTFRPRGGIYAAIQITVMRVARSFVLPCADAERARYLLLVW
jgi:hypothetical protein